MNDAAENRAGLPYDPGVLPTLPAPLPGESIAIEVAGLPPPKDIGRSIRNRNHPLHSSFLTLRNAAIAAMAGRAWVFGPVEVSLTIFGLRTQESRSMADYLGGILDTLDGSSGKTFTFLPIVFEDDCQISAAQIKWIDAPNYKYRIDIRIM